MALITMPKKDVITNWIEIDEAKFKVEYHTAEQDLELKKDARKAMMLFAGESLEFMQDSEKIQKHPNYPEYDSLNLDYMIKYLRYSIKDWENFVTDSDGNEIKCKLAGNKLSKESCEYLYFNDGILSKIFSEVKKVVELTDTDKKKLN